jgi:hypothetical protein
MPARLSIWIEAMSRMINALFFEISPIRAYEILSTRFNGIRSASRLGPVTAGE